MSQKASDHKSCTPGGVVGWRRRFSLRAPALSCWICLHYFRPWALNQPAASSQVLATNGSVVLLNSISFCINDDTTPPCAPHCALGGYSCSRTAQAASFKLPVMSTQDTGDSVTAPAPQSRASSSSPASSFTSSGTDHLQSTVTHQHDLKASVHSAYSPTASVALLRTEATLEGLSRQLAELSDDRLAESDPDLFARCCCGAVSDCPTIASRERISTKLQLCGGEHLETIHPLTDRDRIHLASTVRGPRAKVPSCRESSE